jgi:hypothetical protein
MLKLTDDNRHLKYDYTEKAQNTNADEHDTTTRRTIFVYPAERSTRPSGRNSLNEACSHGYSVSKHRKAA